MADALLSKHMMVSTVSDKDIRRQTLTKFDSGDFERFIADLWSERGWTTAVLPQGGDFDIEAKKSPLLRADRTVKIRCHPGGGKVESEEVLRTIDALDRNPGIDAAVIVSPSWFRKQAQDVASKSPVETINGYELVDIIDEAGAAGLVLEYGM